MWCLWHFVRTAASSSDRRPPVAEPRPSSDMRTHEYAWLRAARGSHRGASVHDAILEPMVDPELQRERLRPLMRREYDALVDQGFLVDERIELLRGMLVEMSPQGPAHAGISEVLAQFFSSVLPRDQYRVRAHSPYAATDDSEPEPDVLVARGTAAELTHPTTALLLVEVSLESLRKDRTVKLGIYAEAGVPEYWIIDVEAQTVEVYTQPVGLAYQSVQTFDRNATLRPIALPSVEVSLTELPWDAPKQSTKRRR